MVKRTPLMINFNPKQGDNIPPSLQMLAPVADWDPKGLLKYKVANSNTVWG